MYYGLAYPTVHNIPFKNNIYSIFTYPCDCINNVLWINYETFLQNIKIFHADELPESPLTLAPSVVNVEYGGFWVRGVISGNNFTVF